MAKDLLQRVADEARPPAVWGRYGMFENADDVLLDDLVESGAWLDLELKKQLLALWVMMKTSTTLIVGENLLLVVLRRMYANLQQWTQ